VGGGGGAHRTSVAKKSCLKSCLKNSGGGAAGGGGSSVRKSKGFTAGMLGMSVDGKKRVRFQCSEHEGQWRGRNNGGGKTIRRITMMPNQPYHLDGLLNDQAK
jgi:hypothetical protein